MNAINKVKALRVEESGSNLIMIGNRNHSYYKYFINGKKCELGNFYLNDGDSLTVLRDGEYISHYLKNETIMSVDEYKKYPTFYDEDYCDSDVLIRIANKKKLEAFKAVHKKYEHEPVEIKIIGYIKETGSKFITQFPEFGWGEQLKNHFYGVDLKKVAMNEYLFLSEKYSEHGAFEKPSRDREYLRFVKVNNNFCFSDTIPFSESTKPKYFTSLEEAKECELSTREAVRCRVNGAIFKEKCTEYKIQQVLSMLKKASKSKTLKESKNILSILTKDLKDYHNLI